MVNLHILILKGKIMLKLVRILIILVLLTSAVQAKSWTVSVMGNSDSLEGRVGYLIDPNTEVGILSAWFTTDDTPQCWGAYGIRQFSEIQIPNPIDTDWLPATFDVTPYVGLETGLNFNNRGTFCNPLAGVRLGPLVAEYKYIISDNQLDTINGNQEISLGLIYKF